MDRDQTDFASAGLVFGSVSDATSEISHHRTLDATAEGHVDTI